MGSSCWLRMVVTSSPETDGDSLALKKSGIRRRAFGKPLSTHQDEILGSGKGRARRGERKSATTVMGWQ